MQFAFSVCARCRGSSLLCVRQMCQASCSPQLPSGNSLSQVSREQSSVSASQWSASVSQSSLEQRDLMVLFHLTHTLPLYRAAAHLGTEDPFSDIGVTEKEGKGGLRLAKTPVREQAALFFRPYSSSCFWTLSLVIRIPEFCVLEMSTSISPLTEHCHQKSNVWFSNYELLLGSQTLQHLTHYAYI